MLEAQTKNQGILEAIKEVRLMGMSKTLKMLHDAHMKERRDQNARDDYVRNEGRLEGREEGRLEGRIEGITEGRLEGEDRFGQLVLKLTADKRFAEIQQAAADKAYRDRLYQEYKL